MMDLVEPAPPSDLTQPSPKQESEDTDITLPIGSSAKIKQLIKILELTPGNEKSLVFSQFTSFLDKVSIICIFCGCRRPNDMFLRSAKPLMKLGMCLFRYYSGRSDAWDSIAYVRFDGKMSARSRKEVIERFTVPVEDRDSDDDSSFVSSPVAKRQRRQKSGRKISVIVIDSSEEETEASVTEEDTDDDFVDAAGLIAATQASKGKSKKKGKAKATQCFNGAWGDRSNPKVMLISLKAGALGLNLTVANNVFL